MKEDKSFCPIPVLPGDHLPGLYTRSGGQPDHVKTCAMLPEVQAGLFFTLPMCFYASSNGQKGTKHVVANNFLRMQE